MIFGPLTRTGTEYDVTTVLAGERLTNILNYCRPRRKYTGPETIQSEEPKDKN